VALTSLIEPRRALGEGDRRRRVAAPPERQAELKMRDGVAGRNRDDPAKAVHGFALPLRPKRRERGAQAQRQRPASRVLRERRLEFRDALVVAARAAQQVTQRAARHDERGIELDRGAQMFGGALHIPAPAEQATDFVVGARVGGIERERAAIARERLLGRAGRVERAGELALKRGVPRACRNQIAQQRDRVLEIAGLQQHVRAIASGRRHIRSTEDIRHCQETIGRRSAPQPPPTRDVAVTA